MPLDDKISFLHEAERSGAANKGVFRVQSQMAFDYEWKYLATSEGSYIEQEVWRTSASYHRRSARGKTVKTRTFTRAAAHRRLRGDRSTAQMLENAARIAAEAVEHASAPPVGAGLKDLIMTPSHAMLTIHEIIAHPTELDRVMGYEANYAGTSFIKLADVGKLKYGSKLFNVTADRTHPRRHVHDRLRR